MTRGLAHDPQEVPDLQARGVGQRVELDEAARPAPRALERRVHLHPGAYTRPPLSST